MAWKSPELRGFHGIIKTAPKSACNTRQGLTARIDSTDWRATAMVPATCSIEDCEGKKYCRGFCIKHYGRWRSHGDPTITLAPVAGTCAVDGCDLKHHSKGYCSKHSARFKKNGDPLIVGNHYPGRPRLAAPKYDSAHKRIHRERGKAAIYACVDCGERAQEWSYDGGCPNELYEVKEKLPIAYSLDQSRYSPRCLKCHRGRDESLTRLRGKDGRFMA